ncbi:hypothetical protein ABT147_47005, partial [Streptomyces sp. NPDC001868]
MVLNSVVFRSSSQDLTTWGTYTEMASRFTEPVLLAGRPRHAQPHQTLTAATTHDACSAKLTSGTWTRLHHLAAGMSGSSQKAKKQPRPVRTVRRDGREPMGLDAAIGALVTERAWELPAAGEVGGGWPSAARRGTRPRGGGGGAARAV